MNSGSEVAGIIPFETEYSRDVNQPRKAFVMMKVQVFDATDAALRLSCSCGAATTIPLTKVGRRFQVCPNCNKPWPMAMSHLPDAASMIAEAIKELEKEAPNYSVQFETAI